MHHRRNVGGWDVFKAAKRIIPPLFICIIKIVCLIVPILLWQFGQQHRRFSLDVFSHCSHPRILHRLPQETQLLPQVVDRAFLLCHLS